MAIRKPLFVIPLDLGAVTTGNETAGHLASYLGRHKAPGLTWRSNGNANLYVVGDFGAARALDFCAIAAANALPGTTIRLRLATSQANLTAAPGYDSTAMPFIDPAITRDDGLYHSHLELPSVQTFRWWRIDIGGHTGDFEAAMLVLGRKVEPSHFYNFDHEYGAEDLGELEITRLGVMNETPGVILRSVAFALAWQTEAEFEASFRPMMERLGTRGVLYLVFDPEPTVYRQARTYMGVMKKIPFARGVRKGRTFAQDFQIISFI